MNVAIVGAGWAGLAAAVALSEAGATVDVFEAGKIPGGRARSIVIDGRTLDNGQHLLLGAYHKTLALMHLIGVDPDVVMARQPLHLSDDQGFCLALPRLPAPLHLAWGLWRAQGIPARDKWTAARWMQRLKRDRFILDEDLTVSAWLDQAGQQGPLRRALWEPLCLAALNTPAERASAQLFANVLRDSLGSRERGDTDLLLPRRPLGELFAEPAVAHLHQSGNRVHFSCRVRRLEADGPRWRIEGKSFDYAIVAVAPQHLAALDLPLDGDRNAPDLASWDYEPIATVYQQFSAKTRLPTAVQALNEPFPTWRVDRGQGMRAIVLSGQGAWEALDDTALLAALAVHHPADQTPEWQRIVREKRATFSARPGLLRPPATTRHPTLFLAGDSTWADYPATLEGAVRSGLRAAALVQAHHTGRSAV